MTDKTLEPPPRPAAPMTSTPKQRADLAAVRDMLRGGQPGGAVDEEEDDADDVVAPNEVAGDPPPNPANPTKAAHDAAAFGAPAWFRMPPGGLPADVEPGTVLTFVKFPTWLTGNAKRGERQCALRPLTPKLERFAQERTATDKSGYALTTEYAKLMICVADGNAAEHFAAGPGSVNHFWAEIGPKAREAMIILFNRTHRFTVKERDDFLSTCVDVRTHVGG